MPPTTRSATTSTAPAAKRRKTEHVDTYLCFSCDTERISKQFPDQNPASECEHLINTCKGCLKKWVEAQVESATFATGGLNDKIFGIRCPECDVGIMKNVNIEIAAAKKVYQRLVVSRIVRLQCQRRCATHSCSVDARCQLIVSDEVG